MFNIANNNKRNAENTRRGEEPETRLIGIPNAPCLNLNAHHIHPDHVAVGSPVSGVSLTSESSPSSPFSNGFRWSGDGSPYSAPFLDRKHQTPNDHCSTKLWLASESSDFLVGKSISDKWVDDLGLSEDFSRMTVSDGQGNGTKTRGYDIDTHARSLDANIPCFTETGGSYQHVSNEGIPFPSSTWGVSPSFVADMKWALPTSGKGYTFGSPVESSLAHDQSGALYSGSTWNTNQIYLLVDQRKKQGSSSCEGEIQLQNPSFITPHACDRFMGSQPFGMDNEAGRSVRNPLRFSQMMHPKLTLNLDSPSHYCPETKERARATANSELPQCLSPRRAGGNPVAFRCDNSFIIQGKDIKHCFDNGCNSLRGCKKNSHNEVAVQLVGEKISKHISHTPGAASRIFENNSTLACDFPLPLLLNFYSLAEVQGYIYNLAKDQNGCRFLQRMVDEGTYDDMGMVFEGIIDNVVELMMDPFGNYLVQKLLDACSEDQRLQIVLMLTKEPGQLVRISLNTHGTRVVQKLIETLNSRKQISLVKSAIQPGFLDLIKDLNGNHVIQRCLQCLSCQDNEFIFDAGVKFCVEIATHRHGCCVLQRCIDHSMGKYRDKLVTEICRQGLLLAQDPFGNYVVQYIIEMEIPTASTKLIAQFKGNYLNLSTQKFSSHVVEKCLKHVGESRSRIVRELLSAPHLEQLLQDPYANYVIQSALAVTKGSLHASLVEAVRPYKILRTSPYCKRIFSGSLLNK